MGYRRRFRAPVRHNKEIVDTVTLVVAAGVTTRVVIAQAVNDYIGTVGSMPISAKVKALWVEISYTKSESTVGRLDWYIAKEPGGVTLTPTPGATGGTLQRKYIFIERKGLTSNDGLLEQGGSPARFAGWVMIPKRYQNMAEGDAIQLAIGSSVVHNVCAKILYKWIA